MICVIISNGKSYIELNKELEKRDCRLVRQPLSLLPKEMKEYIEKTKNENLRLERYLAYTSLFSGLAAFFDVENAQIKKTDKGKPFLAIDGMEENDSKINKLSENIQYQKNKDFDSYKDTLADRKSGESNLKKSGKDSKTFCCQGKDENKRKKIYIGISHSDGVSAVCLSDEGEVGIDIQSVMNDEQGEKLNNRFFPDVRVENTDIGVRYYFCSFTEDDAMLEMIDLDKTNRFCNTVKWAYSESLIKLFGGGFSDLEMLRLNDAKTETEIKKCVIDREFILTVSTYKKSKNSSCF